MTLVPTIIWRPIVGLRFSTSMSFHLKCFAGWFLPFSKTYHIQAKSVDWPGTLNIGRAQPRPPRRRPLTRSRSPQMRRRQDCRCS